MGSSALPNFLGSEGMVYHMATYNLGSMWDYWENFDVIDANNPGKILMRTNGTRRAEYLTA